MIRVLLAIAASVSAEPGWIVAAEEDGIRIEEPTGGSSPPFVFRASGTVDASPRACLVAVRADAFFRRTAPHVEEARVVASEGESIRWFYARIGPPFVAARDYTLRLVESEIPTPAGVGLRLAWNVDNGRGPAPREGTIRIERSDGAWTFRPVAGGRTRVDYELTVDPGGSIPRWLARRLQLDAIATAFGELRRSAEAQAQSGREVP